MPEVSGRTAPNRCGKDTVLPATMMIAIVSPMARPTPRITPARMPDLAAGICTLKIVPICVLPNARDASLYEGGTASNAFCATLMIVGKIIMARIRITASRLSPLVRPGNSARRPGTITRMPKKPKMTEGMPASSSTAGRTIPRSQRGASSARNTAVSRPTGTPSRTAPTVPKTEVSTI